MFIVKESNKLKHDLIPLTSKIEYLDDNNAALNLLLAGHNPEVKQMLGAQTGLSGGMMGQNIGLNDRMDTQNIMNSKKYVAILDYYI